MTDPATRRLWIGIPGPELDATTREVLDDVRPGGIVLFRRNVASLEGVRGLIADLHEFLGEDVIVSVDHEGGLVTRFHKELTVFPGNMALGAAAFREPSMGEHLAQEQGLWSARELRDLGIHVNLSPVLDLATRGDNPGITIRSFGAPARLATQLGVALVRGTQRGGVHATLKHFPGKGHATVDAHIDLPVIPDCDQSQHLAPFRACIEERASCVMTSHVVYQSIDPDQPATFSPAVVDGLLRGDLGFEGVVISDDLEMGAMQRHYEFDDIVRRVSAAGHDALCIAHDPALHRRAAKLLRDAYASGDAWYGDPDAIEARLDGLRPLNPTGAPDYGKAASIAEAISGRAITVIRDDASLLPVSGDGRTVLALPTLRSETGVEDPLRGEADLSDLGDALNPSITVHLPTEPTADDVDRVLAESRDATLFLGLTNARFLEAQASLARRCVESHERVVVLLLRNPFDGEVLTDLRATVVASYGFRPMQLRALAQVVRGETQAYGMLPVELANLQQ